jgi:ubiquinone/menaquinone biosynthesis C-methylase UbiE
MLEWTGERFLPWIKESTIAYEHLHRYAYASTLVKKKRVLDLACGEGYGSNLLGLAASSVVGIDIDANVISHASEKYRRENLRFLTASITAVPIQKDHCFDVIVCFEAIEHLDNQHALLTEAKRLLDPEGLLIVSTPNKPIYREESQDLNPFHVKELHFAEFEELLAGYFRNVKFLGQRVHPSSSMWPIGETGDNRFHEFVMERGTTEFNFISAEKRVALYFIAIASDAAIAPPVGSVLLDDSDSLLEEREETVASLEEALKWREGQLSELQTVNASLTDQFQKTQSQLTQATDALALIYASRAWKLIMRLRSIRDRLRGFGKSREAKRE